MPDRLPGTAPRTDPRDDDVRFVVQVADQSTTRRIADALRQEGLQIERILPTLGVVGGHGPSALGKVMGQMHGVSMVREERGFDLPPFDERVPQ